MDKNKKKQLNGFTLIELIFVVTIIWLVMPSIFSLYTFITKSNREILARQNTIQQWYEFFERLNVLMEDYTIDYEEYYNRQMVWCSKWWGSFWRGSGFTWNTWLSWYCTEFTTYGNGNSISSNGIQHGLGASESGHHAIYYCSSSASKKQEINGLNVVYEKDDCWKLGGKQSYGQYAALFSDVMGDTDWNKDLVWDSDDVKMWRAFNDISAIQDWNNIQELYFISHDGKNRLFFRRKLTNITWDNYMQYKIQILRLRWFDAWMKHNLNDVSSGNVWIYDWVIDTWTCDAWLWFIWKWASIDENWSLYPYYRLPSDENDCWVDLTKWSSSVLAWNIMISPLMDSDLAWEEKERQINAYMKILIVNWIYLPYYLPWSVSRSISDFKVPLETTINMKDFYRI